MTRKCRPVRFCDWWLASRRKCNTRGTIEATDGPDGGPLFFCRRHWPTAAAQYRDVVAR